MSVTVILEAKAKPENRDKLKQLFVDILPDTRAYGGCQGLELIVNQEDPETLIVFERWESRKHYEAYLKWRTDTGALATLVPMLATPPSIRYFDSVKAFP